MNAKAVAGNSLGDDLFDRGLRRLDRLGERHVLFGERTARHGVHHQEDDQRALAQRPFGQVE